MTTPADALNPFSGGEMFTATRGALWELLAETAEGAPHLIYGAECMACPEACRMDNNPRPVQDWAIAHTRTHPTHRQYLLTTHKHGRVAPVHRDHRPPRQPGTLPRATREPPPSRPTRLPGPAARLLATLGRFAGLLFLVSLSTACGLVIGTALATRAG